MKSFLAALACLVALSTANASPASLRAGWRGETVYGKYIPDGPGWKVIGEIIKVTDLDTGELVGYHYYRDERSIWVMRNHGQPFLESWDFPADCPINGCSDSKMARVTFLGYKNAELLGELQFKLDEVNKQILFTVNNELLLQVDGETMQIVNGLIVEDTGKPPKELLDPAVYCAKGITCIRSLAFGRLAHEDIRPFMTSDVSWSDGTKQKVQNLSIYGKSPDDANSPEAFLFRTEEELRGALYK